MTTEPNRTSIILTAPADPHRVLLLGPREHNLKVIRHALGLEITARGTQIEISGPHSAVVLAQAVFHELTQIATTGTAVSAEHVSKLIAQHRGAFTAPAINAMPRLSAFINGAPVKPRTELQAHYIDQILTHDLTFGIGPAGSGKTYLAVACAVHMLHEGMINRIVLTRPAVEAGERLGFLPGDLQQKIDPYLRPLFDALREMIEPSSLKRFLESEVIEVCPLAYMRGRTLSDAVVILDEAQNATAGQMRMFLTRLGEGSRMIVTGDASQSDLDRNTSSGLLEAAQHLEHVEGVSVVHLTSQDIVRHALVSKIITAFPPLSPLSPE